jgi:hypothetical protein
MNLSVIVQAVIALIEAILPNLTVSATVEKIIQALITILPAIVQEAQDLAPAVKNIIAALSSNPATTAEQLAALQALDAQVDAAFEQAAAAAQAEDVAVQPSS